MTKTNRNSLKLEQTAKGITIRVLVSARLPAMYNKISLYQQAQSNIE
jgi:hypothetical protein